MRLCSLAVAVVFNAAPVDAQGYGVGLRSCAEFAKDYSLVGERAEDVYFTWAQGFMSGLNLDAVANRRPYRLINGNDMATQKIQIRSYCEAHPLVQYVAAVVDLYSRLPPAP
jgi:hypothetical protein